MKKLIVGALTALFACSGLAQDYPTKPIRIIDAFAPGATTDILARILAKHMSPTFGQPVVIENRTGANGVVGSEVVAKSAPDGYTLFVGSTSTLALNQVLYKMSFDPIKDFAPISMLASQSLIVVVHPSVPVHSMKELAAYGKANPSALNFATPGIGNPVHLATELYMAKTGVPMTHVPFAKGSAAAIPDLLAGRVQVMFAPAYMNNMVKDGRLRALAVTGPRRMDLLPNVPTVAEAGVSGYQSTLWNAMVAPAGTPAPIIQKLNTEVVRILNLPEVRKQLADTGLESIPSTPEEQAKFTRTEAEQWGKLVKDLKITVQ
jgi:tripartite-type tricarboxylate transporter receptor subunit TctC